MERTQSKETLWIGKEVTIDMSKIESDEDSDSDSESGSGEPKKYKVKLTEVLIRSTQSGVCFKFDWEETGRDGRPMSASIEISNNIVGDCIVDSYKYEIPIIF